MITRRRASWLVVVVALFGLGLPWVARAATAAPVREAAPVPDIACDPGAHPEHMQGRVSAADVADGYAAAAIWRMRIATTLSVRYRCPA